MVSLRIVIIFMKAKPRCRYVIAAVQQDSAKSTRPVSLTLTESLCKIELSSPQISIGKSKFALIVQYTLYFQFELLMSL